MSDVKEKENELNIEEKFEEINELIKKLDDKDISLEESFSLYKEGLLKLKECTDIVDGIEKQLIILQEEDKNV
ncbi:MAG: exodeoxyribonuclease VII small subunit [Lachnospiraceae bacterium]|nr:exodeoxyribonuclease VII small subunit [Lachnospiraceae bacterium]